MMRTEEQVQTMKAYREALGDKSFYDFETSWVRPIPFGDKWEMNLRPPTPTRDLDLAYCVPVKSKTITQAWAFRVFSGLVGEAHCVLLKPVPYVVNVPFPFVQESGGSPLEVSLHRLASFLRDGWYLIVWLSPSSGGGYRIYRTIPPEGDDDDGASATNTADANTPTVETANTTHDD